MEHNLFKPRDFEDGKNAVVGDCNGFTMQERWDAETPVFANMILKHTPENGRILDYGCGVGRLAKQILETDKSVSVTGTDASIEMLKTAQGYIAHNARFSICQPERLLLDEDKFDTIYCVYVLQHCPAIEIRDVLRRISLCLKPGGKFVYCSSDFRMAISFDGSGFADDRFLGVNLLEEVARFFTQREPLFDANILNAHPIVKSMVLGEGGLPHPAYVYVKNEFAGKGPHHDRHMLAECEKKPQVEVAQQLDVDYQKGPQKVVLINDLAPGDILLTSIALRSLHKAHPGKYITDMRSPCQELFLNNPYVTPIQDSDIKKAQDIINKLKKNDHLGPQTLGDTTYIIAHYPEIHRSGMTGLSFTDGHRMFVAKQLGIDIPRTGMNPDFYFGKSEISAYFNHPEWKKLVGTRYWVINAGAKGDYTLKQYPLYQQVVDLLRDEITFVQIGHEQHMHEQLDGVIDMRGKTTIRQLAALIAEAEGVVTPISLPMHLAACWAKPCVVPAGAREGARWEMYPNQRFLYYNGAMSCSPNDGDGCWKSKIEDCVNKDENGHAMCMSLIRPQDIAYAIESYYKGGRLKMKEDNPVFIDQTEEPTAFCNSEVAAREAFSAVADEDMAVSHDGVELNTPQINSAVFTILRTLNMATPEDTYLTNYLWHYNKQGAKFMDTYHLMWYIGAYIQPRSVLEIGCRTGISICQLLSAYPPTAHFPMVTLCDLFSDGLCTQELIVKHIRALGLQAEPQFLVGDSLKELPQTTSHYDYILVDGCHEKEYARQDLLNAVAHLNRHGIIVFDDLTPDGCNLQDVWDDFKMIHNGQFTFWENHNGKGVGYAIR